MIDHGVICYLSQQSFKAWMKKMNCLGPRGILLANEGSESGTEDLSSAFKLIPLHLGSTFSVLFFFSHGYGKIYYVTDTFHVPLRKM